MDIYFGRCTIWDGGRSVGQLGIVVDVHKLSFVDVSIIVAILIVILILLVNYDCLLFSHACVCNLCSHVCLCVHVCVYMEMHFSLQCVFT